MAYEQSAGITSNKKKVSKTTVQPGYTKTTTVTVPRDGSGSITTKKQTWGQSSYVEPIVIPEISVPEPVTATQPIQSRGLSEFSMNMSKSQRYRQMASNLATLSAERIKRANTKDARYSAYNNILTGVTGIVSAINGVAGAIVGGVGALFNLGNDSEKDREMAELYSQMNTNVVNYLTNLTNRDTTILNTMDQIYSSMDNLRTSYGSSFVDTMYNFYLARSGMTSDAYSMLTGNGKNVRTFEKGQYGTASEEGGVFDTLTDGNQDMFNNIYAQLSMEDVTGNKNLMTKLVQQLYGEETEFSLQLQGQEAELQSFLERTLDSTGQNIYSAGLQVMSESAQQRGENISYAQQIGSAEAEEASSGLRGGTTGANSALARLSRDLGQIQRAANAASIIGTLKYNIIEAQKNASSTAYNYRLAQKKAVVGAVGSATLSFNSIGRTAQGGERSANYYLDEAKGYQKQFNENFEKMSEKDKDAVFKAIRG